MLQAKIKTRVTLCHSDILLQTIVLLSQSEGIFYIYLFTYMLLATGMLYCISAYVAAGKFPTQVLTPQDCHQIPYIYIYIYVYLGSISSLMQISLNIIDILCLHIFFWIRLNSRITFIVFGGNWFRYCP